MGLLTNEQSNTANFVIHKCNSYLSTHARPYPPASHPHTVLSSINRFRIFPTSSKHTHLSRFAIHDIFATKVDGSFQLSLRQMFCRNVIDQTLAKFPFWRRTQQRDSLFLCPLAECSKPASLYDNGAERLPADQQHEWHKVAS